MKRSAIMAQRARAQAQAQTSASAAPSTLPPFVHKSSAAAAPPLSSAGASAGALPLPQWTADMTKKRRKREAANARSREETQRRQAKREGREGSATAGGGADGDEEEESGAGSTGGRADSDDDIDQLYDQMDQQQSAAASTSADAEEEEEAAVPTALCMSDAKLKFMQQRGAAMQQQQQQRDEQPAAAAAAAAPPSSLHRRPQSFSAPPAAAAAASAAASSNDAAALPAFTSKKAAIPAAQRGSGISLIKRAPGNAPASNDEKPERYYNVGFCARTTKKHKNYDDGVLVVCGRRCTLKDMSGKTVSTVLASFSTDRMEEGASYFIASSEVELGTPIDAKEYLSGRIFVGSTSAAAAPSGAAAFAVPKAAAATPFNRIKAANASAKNNESGGGGAAMMQAIMADPTLLVLNRRGIIEQGEKAVLVEQFLSKQLRDHQRQGVQFLYDAVMGISSKGYEGCILADEMGLGKTLQAITLLYTLLNMSPRKSKGGECSKAIVVCPATLLNNWNREFTKWLGSHRCKPVVLTASLNAHDQQALVRDFVMGAGNSYSVLIVSYELFRKHTDALSQLNNLLLICDEGHRLKSTQQNKTIKALSKLRTKKRIMLTGTPVQNDLSEFFAMCDFVNPNIMGSLHTFRQTFETPISRSRDVSADKKVKALGEARAEELAQRTKNFVLRRTSELLLQYLPEKVEQVLFIPLTPLQAELYRALLRSKDVKRLLSRGSGGPNDALSLQCIGQLKKLANHPALVYEDCMSQPGADEVKSAASLFPDNYVPVANFADPSQSSKLAVLDHLLAAVRREGQKVVVVSNYIQTLDMLEKFLQARDYKWLRLDGQTTAAERPGIVDRFNATYATEHFVFLLSSKAGGVGLNLIGGNRLILFDPDWNPAIDLQAMSRVWRDGQQSTVYIYRFLSTATIDEKIYQRQLRKNELSWSVMNKGEVARGESSLRNFDQSALKDIFSYRDITLCETRDTLKKSSKTDDQQAELAMSIGEFHTDLRKAKDPILQNLPSHLVSTFLNRVSSVEENQRMLEQLAERAKKKLERDLEHEQAREDGSKGAKAAAAHAAEDDDFDEDEEDAEGKENVPKNGSGAAVADTDEDEGECEFGEAPSSASAALAAPAPAAAKSALAAAASSTSAKPFTSAFTAPPRSHHALHTSALPPPRSRSRLNHRASKAADVNPAASSSSSISWPTDEELEAEAAMADTLQPDDAEPDAEDAGFEAPHVAPRSASKKRRRAVCDEEEEGDDEMQLGEEQAAKRQAGEDSASEDDSARPASAHSEQLDAAAAAVVPPPAPVFFTLDTISSHQASSHSPYEY